MKSVCIPHRLALVLACLLPLQSASAQPTDTTATKANYARVCGDDRLSTVDKQHPQLRYTLAPELSQIPVLGVCDDATSQAVIVEIDTSAAALLLLSLRSFEPLWAAAEAAWGNDLGKLRSFLISASAIAPGDRYAGMLPENVSAAISEASALDDLGETDRAQEIYEKTLARISAPPLLGMADLDFSRVHLVTMEANLVSQTSGPMAAVAVIERYEAEFGRSPEFAINLDVNRAALLAEAGEFAKALTLIDTAQAAFLGEQDTDQQYSIAGSNREFSWIRACALSGLGRKAEARQLVSSIKGTDENPVDAHLPDTKPSTKILLRMFRCMDDPVGYFDVFRSGTVAFDNPLWLRMQPGWRRNTSGRLPGWTVPKDLAKMMERHFRLLPATYDAALSGWPSPGKGGG